MQEVTRQKEVDQQTKVRRRKGDKRDIRLFQMVEAQIQSAKERQIRAMEEERRKTLGEETQHAKAVSFFYVMHDVNHAIFSSVRSIKTRLLVRDLKMKWHRRQDYKKTV